MSSSASTIGDFVDQDSIINQSFPVSVNGHTVRATEPEVHVAGADEDVVFECEDCGEKFHPKADRAVSDVTYVENRFSMTPCRTESIV
jgi:hypothetical protein